MKISNINEWLTFLANLGVIAGIIFLSIEINQNSKMMASQTRSELSQSIMYFTEQRRDPRIVEAYRKRAMGEDLQFEDLYLLNSLNETNFQMWSNTYFQYQNGLYSEVDFESETRIWRRVMINDRNMQDTWANRRLNYSPVFRAIIDEMIQ